LPKVQAEKTAIFPFEDGKVEIRAFLPGDPLTIDAETTDVKREYRVTESGDIEPIITALTNRRRDMELTVCRRVVSWDETFLDEGDRPMECNDKNKIKALDGMDGFFNFVKQSGKKIDADVRKEKEAERKNSGNTPSGSAKAATR
jgi:hypothetical protein